MTILQDILAALNWQTRVTENFRSVAPAGMYGINPVSTSGLTLGYLGGEFNGVTVANGTVALTASATNYVVAHRTTGAVTASTATTNWLDTATYLQLYQLVAGVSTFTIAATSDKRQAIGGSAGGGGGAGTVTSVDASGGVETASGAAITATGTVRGATLVNAQTGASYTYVTGDRGKLVTHSNVASIAGTLPQATSTFGAGWFMRVKNKGAGTLTITPTTSTIDGAATLALSTGQWAIIVSDGTNYQAYAYAPGGGGSLTNFTESVATTSPNDTIYAARLIAAGGVTNVDFVATPKGTGALQGQIADSAAAGGNKRGTNATDWSRTRSAANQVASGASSTVSGGANNKASGTGSAVGGGRTNDASGADSFTAGTTNTASGPSATALGDANTATGTAGSVSLGSENTSSGYASVAIGRSGLANADYARTGGYFASARTVVGADAYASGNFSTAGDAQRRELVIRRQTTDATASAVTSTNAAASATNMMTLPSNGAMAFRGDVVARNTSTGDCAMWSVVGLAKSISGTFTLVGTPTVTMLFNDAGASTWVLAITADNTNKAVLATVTGVAATTIRWVGSLQSVEVG